MTQETAHYPIRTVAELTGVNPVTLRAWERRYGLIKPLRTPKGHRLYSSEDVQLIRELVALLESGIAIGQARSYLEHQARQSQPEEPGSTHDWQQLRESLSEAISQFSEEGLERTYNEALSLYPVDIVTERLLKPLLREMGERWQNQRGNIAKEHFFSTYLRNKLGARMHHMGLRKKGPRVVAACLPTEQHELGLLLYCLTATENAGYRFIILGANTPLDEIQAASEQSGATAILLSGSMTGEVELPWSQLKALAGHKSNPLFIGGPFSVQHHEQVTAMGAIPLGVDTRTALRRMELELPCRGRH